MQERIFRTNSSGYEWEEIFSDKMIHMKDLFSDREGEAWVTGSFLGYDHIVIKDYGDSVEKAGVLDTLDEEDQSDLL